MEIIKTDQQLSARNKLTISQVLSYFEKSLSKPNNYLRVVRKYLEFCVTENYLIDDISFGLYTSGQKPNMVSPVRKFLKFAKAHQIFQVVADPVKSEIPPAANALVLSYMRDAKNLRGDHSKETYVRVLNLFFRFLEKNEMGFNSQATNLFVEALLKENKSPFTINLYLSVIKQLADWIVISRHRIEFDFTATQLDGLRDIKSIKSLPIEKGFYKDSLEENERDILQLHIKEPLWQAVVALMVYNGLRAVEVTRLRVKDVHLKEKKIFVKGKGKFTYTPIKLFDSCATYLRSYLFDRQQNTRISNIAALFPELKTSQIQYKVKKLFKDLGLSREKLSTHSLRHTAGQILIDKGTNPVYVQRQLRHKRFETTQFYVQKQIDKDFLNNLPDDV